MTDSEDGPEAAGKGERGKNPLDLSGKVAIVTGGGKGIGRGISQRLLQAGAEVVVCSRSEPATLPSAGQRKAVFCACDVRDPDQITAAVNAVKESRGRLDILVNNAGGAPAADAATASPRFSEAIIRLNLLAPLNFAQAANRLMQEQPGGGAIINIASVSTLRRRRGPRPIPHGAVSPALR